VPYSVRLNKHVCLLLAAAILWSLGGVLIKSIDWTPVAIAGSRSLIAVVVIGLAMPAVFSKISWSTLPGALAYAGTVLLFVIATKLTSAANAIFLQYTAPIYIAIISPWILHERTKPLDWLLILVALCGIALFFVDQLSFEGISGVFAALGSGVSFAWLTVLMRRQRNESPEAIVLLGNVITLLLALPWMLPFAGLQRNGVWILMLGVVQLAIPYLLYSRAIKHIRALDAAIISIIEPILNPVWVILIKGEHASRWSLIGGTVVLTTSLLRSFLASRDKQAGGNLPSATPIPD
jgi:drug/metabolite transporter (DMT)-like permease